MDIALAVPLKIALTMVQVCTYSLSRVCMYMYVCMYVCIYVCMYVCVLLTGSVESAWVACALQCLHQVSLAAVG